MRTEIQLVALLIQKYITTFGPIPMQGGRNVPCVKKFSEKLRAEIEKNNGPKISRILEQYLGKFREGNTSALQSKQSEDIPDSLAQYLYDFTKDSTNKKKGYQFLSTDNAKHLSEQRTLEFLQKLFPTISSLAIFEQKPPSPIEIHTNNFFESRFEEIPEYYIEEANKWYVIIRKSEKEDGDIQYYPLSILPQQIGEAYKVVLKNVDEEHSEFEGVVVFGSECLVFFMHPKKSGKRHLHLTVRMDSEDTPSLLIGQLTYNMKENKRIITHTVVLQKYEGSKEGFIFKEYKIGSPDYYEIDKRIRFYLDERGKNILRSPGTVIESMKDLDEWLCAHNQNFTYPIENIVGYYELFNIQNKSIIRVKAEIHLNFSINSTGSEALKFKGKLEVFGQTQLLLVRMASMDNKNKGHHWQSILQYGNIENQIILHGIYTGANNLESPLLSCDVWIKKTKEEYDALPAQERIPLKHSDKIKKLWAKYPYLREFLSGERQVSRTSQEQEPFDYFFYLTKDYFEMALHQACFFKLKGETKSFDESMKLLRSKGFPYWEYEQLIKNELKKCELILQKEREDVNFEKADFLSSKGTLHFLSYMYHSDENGKLTVEYLGINLKTQKAYLEARTNEKEDISSEWRGNVEVSGENIYVYLSHFLEGQPSEKGKKRSLIFRSNIAAPIYLYGVYSKVSDYGYLSHGEVFLRKIDSYALAKKDILDNNAFLSENYIRYMLQNKRADITIRQPYNIVDWDKHKEYNRLKSLAAVYISYYLKPEGASVRTQKFHIFENGVVAGKTTSGEYAGYAKISSDNKFLVVKLRLEGSLEEHIEMCLEIGKKKILKGAFFGITLEHSVKARNVYWVRTNHSDLSQIQEQEYGIGTHSFYELIEKEPEIIHFLAGESNSSTDINAHLFSISYAKDKFRAACYLAMKNVAASKVMHELEEAFKFGAFQRDEHLRDLFKAEMEANGALHKLKRDVLQKFSFVQKWLL